LSLWEVNSIFKVKLKFVDIKKTVKGVGN